MIMGKKKEYILSSKDKFMISTSNEGVHFIYRNGKLLDNTLDLNKAEKIVLNFQRRNHKR